VTDELKRSGGITAAAVIALVGSVGALLFGSLTVFGGLLATQDPSLVAAPEDPAVPPLAMFVAIGGSQLALGVCGTVSAVGLLRLRNWARLSFVAFSALLGTFSSCGVLLSLIAIPALGLAPPQPEVPQGVLIVVMSLMVLTATTGLALGIWWLIYFKRASVRAQFTGGKPSVSRCCHADSRQDRRHRLASDRERSDDSFSAGKRLPARDVRVRHRGLDRTGHRCRNDGGGVSSRRRPPSEAHRRTYF
jgi:hypothetical protein